jgi:hypothetical protein
MFKKMLLCFLIIGFANTAYAESQSDWKTRTGVRFGYSYINKGDQTEKLKSPHMFLLGFEMQQALKGGSWLDVLFIENVSVAGLDQSVFAPSASLLIGFELADQVQLAIGGNVAPFDPAEEDNYVHLITAIGYTAEVGLFSVPVHLTYIPDTNGFWRCAATIGVNW